MPHELTKVIYKRDAPPNTKTDEFIIIVNPAEVHLTIIAAMDRADHFIFQYKKWKDGGKSCLSSFSLPSDCFYVLFQTRNYHFRIVDVLGAYSLFVLFRSIPLADVVDCKLIWFCSSVVSLTSDQPSKYSPVDKETKASLANHRNSS
jgi:hypothetical protein